MKSKQQQSTAKRTTCSKKQDFEKFIVALSARLVALSPEQVNDEIVSALKKSLEFFRIDRCSLLRLIPGKTSWQVTHNADIAGVSPYPVGSEQPVSLFPWAIKMLAERRQPFSFASLEDLPEEAQIDKQSFRMWNIHSGLYMPIAALKSTEYSLGICSAETGRICPKELIPRLRLLGELFVNAYERSIGEKALIESEERLSLAASAADAGLWVMDTEKGIVWATQKFRDLFQFSHDEELPFDRLLSSIHSTDRKCVIKHLWKSMDRQESLNLEFRVVMPGGMLRWILCRGNPSFESSAPSKRLTGVCIDVSERKKMEAELRDRLKEINQLKTQLEKENICLREEIGRGQGLENIVGSSEAIQYVFYRTQQVAPTDATALVLGETGSGKGMVAHAIHQISTRKERPMVTVNCAALPANLIESELFGREKGAFTGAHAKQVGRFEAANRGTIFLDEIGEMPMDLQAKLLRVLQDGEFERLGSSVTIKVDVRVIASTSRDLKAEIRNHRFREDLFYRLNVFPITIPPLRMRIEDIPQLVHHFVNKYSRKFGRDIKTIADDTIKNLQLYNWPGNVRELEHVIERAVITSSGPVFRVSDRLENESVELRENPIKDLAAMERDHIVKALEKTQWKIDGDGGAASLLGLHPSTLRYRLKKLGVKRP